MKKYIEFLKRNNYSENTIRTYKSILNLYKEDLNDIRLVKNKLKRYKDKPNTMITHYSVLVSYLNHTGDKRIAKLKELKLPQTPNIYKQVFTKGYLYNKTKDLGDKKQIMVRFLFETGLRVSEVSQILAINKETIVLMGKGNKIREVFHRFETTKLIENFDITTKTLRLWVKDVLGQEYSPHSIRRSLATYLLMNGANPKMVMLQLGHSKIETTFKYLNLSKDANMQIYNKYL